MSKRIMVICGQFNELVTRNLLLGCRDELTKAGVGEGSIDELWVPGAFEMPAVAARAARSKNYDAVICLGCVIRGETPHFDYVAGQAASGLMKVSIETEVPTIFGVLTTDTVDQAMARSGLKAGNKGRDSAQAALSMAKTMLDLDEKGTLES